MKKIIFNSLILLLIIIVLTFIIGKRIQNKSEKIQNKNENYYKIITEDVSEFSDFDENYKYNIFGSYKNYIYLVKKIDLVYIKNDGSKVSFLEALEKNYITLKELTSQMNLVSDEELFYKYDGTSEISKDKFSLLICDDKIIVDTFESDIKCW